LALILKELVKHPEYLQIASTMTHIIEPNNKSMEKRYIWNKNKLLQPGNKYYYKDAWAGKTGYTTQSQHSYVAVAEREGQIFIVTLVHDSTADYYKDTINLFNYGFNNFKTNNLFSKNDTVTNYTLEDNSSIPVVSSDNFYYTTKINNQAQPSYELKLDETVLKNSSVKKGDKIGTAEILLEGKTIGSLDLLSGADHEVKPAANAVISLVSPSKKESTPFVLYILYTAVTIVLLVFCVRMYNLHIKKYIYEFRLRKKRADN
jgi:D-alanyl-D-alanine carboxypeptidase